MEKLKKKIKCERIPRVDRIASKRLSTTKDKVVYQNTQPGL